MESWSTRSRRRKPPESIYTPLDMSSSGVMEDGLERASEEGTPQGGSLSALLSNVYLHYVLDLWVERRFKPSCRGEVYLFRYADDFLVCFQHRDEAEEFLRQLKARLEQFHLVLSESKTKRVAFGRFAREDAQRKGKKLETFEFLGFTHYCGLSRKGYFKVKRQTSRKKFHASLQRHTEWLKKHRHRLKTGALLRLAKLKLVGHLNYYSITDNGPRCEAFRIQFMRLFFRVGTTCRRPLAVKGCLGTWQPRTEREAT